MTEDVSACLRTLPRKLKVGAYDYRIVLKEGDHDAWGEADLDTFEVSIWPDGMADASFLAGIVLHELLHVLWKATDLPKRPEEERVVVAFEIGLISIFRDNPKLLTWIKRCLKRKAT